MIEYYESSAESVHAVPLRVSIEEAIKIAADIVEKSDFENENIESDIREALMVYEKDDGVHISSDVYGYTRLDAYDDFIHPFLEKCADFEKLWAIRVCSSGDYGNFQGIHVHCDSTDYMIDDNDTFNFVYNLFQQNLVLINSNGQLQLRD